MMIDEDKKDDELLDDGWLVDCDEDILKTSSIGIWKDCITPLEVDTVTDTLSFVNTMNEQLSAWFVSDKLLKYVYSLNIGYESETGLRDIRKDYIDLLTGIQFVQSIIGKMKEQLIICLAGYYHSQS